MVEPTGEEQKELLAFQKEGVESNNKPLTAENIESEKNQEGQIVKLNSEIESAIKEINKRGITKEDFLASAASNELNINQNLLNTIALELESGKKPVEAPIADAPVQTPPLQAMQSTDLIEDSSFKGTDLLDAPLNPVFTMPEIKQQVFISDQLQKTELSTDELNMESEMAMAEGFSPFVASSASTAGTNITTASQSNLLKSMGDDVEANTGKVEVYKLKEELKPDSVDYKLQESLFLSLPVENKLFGEDFLSVMKQDIDNLHHMSVASRVIAEGMTSSDKILDLGELLVPIYGELIFLDFQNAIADNNADKALNLLVGSNNLDKAVERYWSIDNNKRQEYISGVIDVLNSTETSAGTDNGYLKLDIVSKLFSKIAEGPQAVGKATSTDILPIVETTLSELAVAFPLIGTLKDMFKMRQLRKITSFDFKTASDRIENHNFQKPKYDADPVYPNNNTGAALDIFTGKSPVQFNKLLEGKEIENVVSSMGVVAADMGVRVLPRMADAPNQMPTPPNVHHTLLEDSLQRKIDNSHYALQLAESEKDGLLGSFVVRLSDYLGEAATPHMNKSYFEPLDDAVGTSLGSFVTRIGKNSSSGFEDLSDALRVSKKLYGENAKVVRMLPEGVFTDLLIEGRVGEFFIEVKQKHTFNPKADASGVFIGADEQLVRGGVFKPIMNFVIDDDYLFNSQIQNTFSNIRDRSNAFGVELDSLAAPLGALASNGKHVEDFNVLAMEMQSRGLETADITTLTGILGRAPAPAVVEALKSAQLINLANYRIKNNMEYSILNSEMYKTIESGGKSYISKPILNRSQAVNIKGREIYDPFFDRPFKLSDKSLDSLYEGGGVVASLYKNTKEGASVYTHIVVRSPANEVKALQPNVIPYVKGHFERIYKDGGYIVTGKETFIVNGKPEIQTVAYGISATRAEANKLASHLAFEGKNVDKKIGPTREYAASKGFKTTAAYSLEKSQARGDRLKGLHGEKYGQAEVIDPYSAYIKVLNKTKSKFEQPITSLMKQRWIERYGNLMGAKAFPAELSTLNAGDWFKDPTRNVQTIAEAINFHRRIRISEAGDMERMSSFVNGKVAQVAMVMGENPNKIAQAVARALDKANLAKIQSIASGYASARFIWGNPLYQALSVFTQMPFLFAQSPLLAAKSMMETTHILFPALMSRGGEGHEFFLGLAAKELGTDLEGARKYLNTIIDTGIIRTAGVGQDYATEANNLYKTLMETKATRGVTTLATKAVNIPMKGAKGMVLGSIDLFELFSFVLAKKMWQKDNPEGDWMKAQSLDAITVSARNMTLHQNDTARYSYQNNDSIFRIPMAMTSYTNRMFMRQYLDPLTLGLLGKIVSPKGDKAVKNLYTKSLAVSLGTGAIGIGMYGESYLDPLDGDFYESQREYLQALAYSDYRSLLTPDVNKMFKDVGIDNPSQFLLELQYQGMNTAGMNAMFKGNVDWNEMFTTNSYLKMMYDKVSNLSKGNVLEVVGGIPYLAGAGLVNVFKHSAQMFLAKEELEIFSKETAFAGIELLSQVKIVDESVAIYAAINMGRRVTKTNYNQRDKTTIYEQLAKLAGGIPLSEFYSRMNFDASDMPRGSSDDYANSILRKANLEIINASRKEGENLTKDEVNKIVIDNYKLLYLGSDEYRTEKAEKDFKKGLVTVGSSYKYGDVVVNREMQQEAITLFKWSLKDKGPEEWRAAAEERVGMLELQIDANPNEAALKSEKAFIENYLNKVARVSPEELNKIIFEERTND